MRHWRQRDGYWWFRFNCGVLLGLGVVATAALLCSDEARRLLGPEVGYTALLGLEAIFLLSMLIAASYQRELRQVRYRHALLRNELLSREKNGAERSVPGV